MPGKKSRGSKVAKGLLLFSTIVAIGMLLYMARNGKLSGFSSVADKQCKDMLNDANGAYIHGKCTRSFSGAAQGIDLARDQSGSRGCQDAGDCFFGLCCDPNHECSADCN
jgi:hypothetical protein